MSQEKIKEHFIVRLGFGNRYHIVERINYTPYGYLKTLCNKETGSMTTWRKLNDILFKRVQEDANKCKTCLKRYEELLK